MTFEVIVTPDGTGDYPTIQDAIEALSRVGAFLEGEIDDHEVGDDFEQDYVDRHNHRPSFSSRKFWAANLDL